MVREIILDTETTGLNPLDGHKIIEIGAIELIDYVKTGRYFHSYINPERDIPEASQKIHNISNEMVRDKPVFKEIIQEFLNFIKFDSIVIHNAEFDLGFLNYELNCHGSSAIKNNIVDTLLLAKSKYPGSSVSLDSLCKRFNIDLKTREDEGHGALVDCYLLSDVYLEILGGKQPNLNFKNDNKKNAGLNEIQENGVFFRKRKIMSRLNKNTLLNHQEFIKEINCEDIWSNPHRNLFSKLKRES